MAERALWAGKSFFALVVGQCTVRVLVDICASSRSNSSPADSDPQVDEAPALLVRLWSYCRSAVADFSRATSATLFAGRAAQLAGHQSLRVCCGSSTTCRQFALLTAVEFSTTQPVLCSTATVDGARPCAVTGGILYVRALGPPPPITIPACQTTTSCSPSADRIGRAAGEPSSAQQQERSSVR